MSPPIFTLDKYFRYYTKYFQISPSISGSVLTLKAPGMMPESVDLAILKNKYRAAVWGQIVPVCDCGEEVARWLSRFLLQEDRGLRLVYYPLDKPTRDVRDSNKPFPLMEPKDTVSKYKYFTIVHTRSWE